ncbi:hypothetical protein PIB30_080381 [Stylosanthes scabra]|uniref:Uncharacterized protein n=1 Tax=Stylosanthes scabra TaxID=79078 RepID=A0ABU6YQF2_9FABA|nr:hypothetical protein [Stylosanthes scabra]
MGNEDDSSTSSDEDEVANICLMANKDEEHVNQIEMLKSSLAKFNASSKNLDKILSSQKHVNDREGIGYDINNPSSSKENKVARKPIRQPQAQKHASTHPGVKVLRKYCREYRYP